MQISGAKKSKIPPFFTDFSRDEEKNGIFSIYDLRFSHLVLYYRKLKLLKEQNIKQERLIQWETSEKNAGKKSRSTNAKSFSRLSVTRTNNCLIVPEGWRLSFSGSSSFLSISL